MFWLLLAIPIIVPFIAKYYFKHEYTLLEMCANWVIALLLTAGVYGLGKYSQAWDFEILNGYVVSKSRDYVSCEHSYQVCVPVCNGKSCSTRCTTHYEHSNDWDYNVKTSVGTVTINRVDRRGVNTPPRWNDVVIGEPASVENSSYNYVKAVPDSIFHFDKKVVEQYQSKIPNYPQVFDYYKYNRVINYSDFNPKGWNEYLNDKLKTMGASKQVNIIVILTNEDANQFDAIKYNWIGGKKNDVILMYGVDNGKVVWFNSTSFADGINNQEMHITLRNKALNENLDLSLLQKQVEIIEHQYNRVSMEDFSYLEDAVEPPTWCVILAFIISLLSSVGLAIVFGNNNIRNFKQRKYYR